jgi:uncharacterized protein
MTDTSADPRLDATLLAALAEDVALPLRQVTAAVQLLVEGNTIPFVARYRKEVTGGLDEVQLRAIEERHAYRVELEARRATILASLGEQGVLDDALRARVLAAATRVELEDLYLPFRPKRRTRATIARERGLQPLAERILAQPRTGDARAEAAAFVAPDKEVPDADAALQGARDIVAEAFSEHADVRAAARDAFHHDGLLRVRAARKELLEARESGGARTKFEEWYEYEEPLARVPSHRFLAVRRGEREDVLRTHVVIEEERLLPGLLRRLGHAPGTPFAGELEAAARDGWKRLLAPSLETESMGGAKERADLTAVDVFQKNLRDLLLAAPLGGEPVVGIDPGLRTGCKCAAIDGTGRFLGNITIFPHEGASGERRSRAATELLAFVRAHRPKAVAVGNGTAGRETEQFAREALKAGGLGDVVVVMVSESGASVYSASDIAREEFPDLDLTVRGAISIARRLQDPLAELVKVEPKAIGVGQYQHDVDQGLLQRRLDAAVESCVNAVGVELNTASAALLGYVAGLGPKRARTIVAHRDANGPFRGRKALLKVGGLGPKTFEQAAGFLRVRGGEHPLDASAVHPERYALVERMAKDLGVPLDRLVGDAALVDAIPLAKYTSADVGEPTLKDIVAELRKPGRDPRDRFEPPRFRDDVRTVADLQTGMQLEGVVTNVTAFGAFVDIGVHRDGLVHVSELSDRFVRDPGEVVKVGDRLQVRVLDVDHARERISLSARAPREGGGRDGGGGRPPERRPDDRRPDDRRPDDRRGGPGGRDDRRGPGGRDDRRGPAAPPAPGFRNNPFASLLGKDTPSGKGKR